MIYREKAIKLFDRLRPEGSFTGSRRCNGVNCENCPFKTIPGFDDITSDEVINWINEHGNFHIEY